MIERGISMSVLVINCFHWIGFQIVSKLLEEGLRVDGIDEEESTLETHLSMFLGRNSLFTLKTNEEPKSYDTAIIIGTSQYINEINAKRILSINQNKDEPSKAGMTMIHVPLLFGEWMPMNEQGMYVGGGFIPFNENYFLTESVYVKDFTDTLFQLLEKIHLPTRLEVKSKETTENQDIKFENVIFIRDNIPNGDKLKSVLDHYQQYKRFYQ